MCIWNSHFPWQSFGVNTSMEGAWKKTLHTVQHLSLYKTNDKHIYNMPLSRHCYRYPWITLSTQRKLWKIVFFASQSPHNLVWNSLTSIDWYTYGRNKNCVECFPSIFPLWLVFFRHVPYRKLTQTLNHIQKRFTQQMHVNGLSICWVIFTHINGGARARAVCNKCVYVIMTIFHPYQWEFSSATIAYQLRINAGNREKDRAARYNRADDKEKEDVKNHLAKHTLTYSKRKVVLKRTPYRL